MKSALRKSAIPHDQVFVVKELHEPHFDPNWHFHPEYQLFAVLEGSGTRFVGDHIQPFGPGELVFTGPDLPHLWRSDNAYFAPGSGLMTHGIVVYFHADMLGSHFFEKKEMYKLRLLLDRARRGIEAGPETSARVIPMLQQLVRCEGFAGVRLLLDLLDTLSQASDLRLIVAENYSNLNEEKDTRRINDVHHYVLDHFRTGVSLETAASIANMSPAAFSRYFSARANKNFSTFVSEVRIGHACRLLLEDQLSVIQISYECGFRTLSNFNRQFKAVTGKSPRAYKKAYEGVM
ncbi:MAG: AraC family transcriptional regulator [Bacteroidetes bacterium]|nr:MAG: AraC family transcriptional regulator [Bacteroidota bacterium]